ncbi:MAG: DNA polymerase III subunit beta [Actinobacteria bacterium]|nr:MAG: DNA polymerase III subunit beta [Actinomycetota bacterium]
MRITMARGEMLEALTTAGRAVSNRSTLPILSGILISAKDDTATFQATDLEVSVRTKATADVGDPGDAVIPGKIVSDIVRSLPEAAVTLSADKDGGKVECGQAVFHLNTVSPEDFPKFPEIEADTEVSIPAEAFAALVKQVAKAVSRDETRPILTGVLTVVEGPVFRMVATDSYRLAVREVTLEQSPGSDLEVVVPGRAVEEVPKLAGPAQAIRMGISENQVVFNAGDTTFVTRRIEGSFPNYRQLIQQDRDIAVTVGRDELLEAVKRVSLLAQHNAALKVAVKAKEGTLSLSAATEGVGDAAEDLMVGVAGDDVELAFNHSFFADGVASVGTERLTMRLATPMKSGTLESEGDEEFLYLLMPVRL